MVLIPIYLIKSGDFFCYENNSSTRECKKKKKKSLLSSLNTILNVCIALLIYNVYKGR